MSNWKSGSATQRCCGFRHCEPLLEPDWSSLEQSPICWLYTVWIEQWPPPLQVVNTISVDPSPSSSKLDPQSYVVLFPVTPYPYQQKLKVPLRTVDQRFVPNGIHSVVDLSISAPIASHCCCISSQHLFTGGQKSVSVIILAIHPLYLPSNPRQDRETHWNVGKPNYTVQSKWDQTNVRQRS